MPAVPAPATDVSQVVEEAMPAVVAVASTAVYQMPGLLALQEGSPVYFHLDVYKRQVSEVSKYLLTPTSSYSVFHVL